MGIITWCLHPLRKCLERLEHSGSVGLPERHHPVLEVADWCLEHRLPLVSLVNANMMVGVPEAQLCEDALAGVGQMKCQSAGEGTCF